MVARTEGEQAERHQRLVEAVVRELDGLMEHRPKAGLHVVATPIGNLNDVSLRSLWIIEAADFVYCEDTRHTRNLLTRFSLSRGLRVYHDHSDDADRDEVVALLAAGKSVALVSDAGTPLVSDPGFKLVRAALAAGHNVFAVPGPSAVLAALSICGLATDSFVFTGFLPQKRKARFDRLQAFVDVPATLVLFEAANRLQSTLEDIFEAFGNRSGAVAREITKINEEVRTGTLEELARWAATATIKGEVTVVIGPPLASSVSDSDLAVRLGALLESMSVRDAVRQVVDELGVAKGRAYDMAVALARGQRDAELE